MAVNKVILNRLYIEEQKSLIQIAKQLNMPYSAVRKLMINYGIPMRTRVEGIRLAGDRLGSGMRGKKRVFSNKHIRNIKISAEKRWKTEAKGISLKPNGYYEITRGSDKGKHLHVVIMELLIGRKLNKDEVVHHKNGCKTDNSISNLELMTRSKHSSIHAKMNNKIRNRNDLGQYI